MEEAAYAQRTEAEARRGADSGGARPKPAAVVVNRRARYLLAAAVIVPAWWTAYLWATTPRRWQGRVVFTVAHLHGIHISDLPAIGGAALVTIVALRWASARR